MNKGISYIAAVFVFLFASVHTTPLAFASDTQPPKLVDWTLLTEVSDISNFDTELRVRFIISDDSQVEVPNLLLRNNFSTQMTSFARTTLLSKSGNLYSFESIATVRVGQAPRQWQWVLYPLRDALGNTDGSFGPSDSWKKEVTILNGEYTRAILACEKELVNFNRVLDRFLKIEESKPNYKPELEVLRLKFELPTTLLSTRVCESEASYSGKFANLAVGLSDAMTVTLERISFLENAKAEAEAKAKAEAEAKAKAEAEAKAKAEATRKTTILCVKGKTTKRVSGVNPKCPKGFRKR